jgi:hypothetical protein
MKHPLQSLIDAPLADAVKINLPAGRRPAPRAKKPEYGDELGCPKLTGKEIRQRKEKTAAAKLDALFDYYAGTDLTPEKVTAHLGLYRNEQTGVVDGKPTFKQVPDVERVAAQLAWRRNPIEQGT